MRQGSWEKDARLHWWAVDPPVKLGLVGVLDASQKLMSCCGVGWWAPLDQFVPGKV